jgi:biopolymer transport protein ExbD
MDAGNDNSYNDINVTPMVDLYLVLLLIFIIMTTAGVQGVKVDLPKGSKAPAIGGPKGKSVTVNNEGKLFLDTVPVTIAELEAKLAVAQEDGAMSEHVAEVDGRVEKERAADRGSARRAASTRKSDSAEVRAATNAASGTIISPKLA